jgi:lipopolysaccharide biosynthesis glycosyltransferase
VVGPEVAAQSQLALCFAGDEGFARSLAVAMHSAVLHLSPTITPVICVLDNGISNSSRERLLRVGRRAGREVQWIRVPPERLLEQTGTEHLTPTTFSRLLIPDLLPAGVRRAVYLDGDLLVKSDISPLFELDLEDAPIAAVRDFAIGSTDHELARVRDPVVPRPYFNTGVLVMDLPRWREAGLAERVLAYAAAESVADQDAINAVVERCRPLDLRWNVQSAALHRIEDTRTDLTERLRRDAGDLYRDAAILHFSGYHKPWNPWATPPGAMLWARALRRSGWYKAGEYLGWVLPWLGKRAAIATGRRAAVYAPRAIGDAGRRAAKWSRER